MNARLNHAGAEALNATEQISALQICLLVLSLVGAGALLADSVTKLPTEISRTIQGFDAAVCLFLFLDFSHRLWRAPDRASFMRTGWVDLIACVPSVDFLRAGRFVRILRIIRVLRGLRAGYRIFQIFRNNKSKSALATALTTTVLMIVFASISILIAETDPESNIKTADDAVWWSVTTLTTIGYGDRYPVTGEGRIIAMALMFGGVGLFGTLSGVVASVLVGKDGDESENADLKEVLERLKVLEAKLDRIASHNGHGVEDK